MSTAVQMSETAARTQARSFYTRVAALGFGLIALSGVVALIASVATGNTGGDAVFALVFLVVGLLVAGAAWTSRGWALILAAVLSLALLALVGPFALFILAHPESATEFVPVVLMLAGAVLGLVGSLIALVQSRRRLSRTRATGTERLALGTVLGVLALAVVLSLALTVTARTTVSAAARTGATSIQVKNFVFSPSTAQAHAGDPVRVVVRNDDTTLHTFTLAAAGVDVAIPPGSERLVEFKLPAAGVYQWYCVPHSAVDGGIRTGMTGTLVVD